MRLVTGDEEVVHRLWNPTSVALVGASGREGTLAWWPRQLLQQYAFGGRIFPVNPKYPEIGGLPCAASVLEIDIPIDVAVVTLDAQGTCRAVEECAAAGVGAVVLPAQGFGESTPEGKVLERRMLDTASAAGMRVHGPNTDGLANFATGAVMSIQPILGQGVEVGDIAVLTQSGATAASLVSRLKAEGLGVRLYASVGNEVDLGLADYMSVALQDPGISMVLTFIEAIRHPEDFVAVARLAAELGKPIVAIKVGRTQQAAARAAAHTGAMAGEDRIYQALFDSLGVIRVDELSEIVSVAKLHLAGAKIRSSSIGIMSVSGGQAGALADRAASFGLNVPQLTTDARSALAELLPHGSVLNPCDLTGDVAVRPALAAQVYAQFDRDPGLGALVYARKNLTGDVGRVSADALSAASRRGTTPLVVYSMDGTLTPAEHATYHAASVPVFTSAAELFRAIEALAAFSARPATTLDRPPARASTAIQASGILAEQQARGLLGEYGVAFPVEHVVTDADTAVKAAQEIGYPVALKVVSSRLPHKTEIGGVVLGLDDENSVRATYDLIVARGRAALGGDDVDGVLVQQQINDGVEMILGLVVDDQFGPFVLVGTGGVMAELLDDAALAPAPVDASQARAMVDSLRGRPLLDGFRGAPEADVDALIELIVSVSRLGDDHRDVLAELDLNPVLVRPRGGGVVSVDALVVLKGDESRE